MRAKILFVVGILGAVLELALIAGGVVLGPAQGQWGAACFCVLLAIWMEMSG